MPHTIDVDGKPRAFEFNRWSGPVWLCKNGNHRACQNPVHRVWEEFDKWLKTSEYWEGDA